MNPLTSLTLTSESQYTYCDESIEEFGVVSLPHMWPKFPSSVADILVFTECGFSYQAFQKYKKVGVGVCTCTHSTEVLEMSGQISSYLEFWFFGSVQNSRVEWGSCTIGETMVVGGVQLAWLQ